jgi:diaminopimelate decarboxylase
LERLRGGGIRVDGVHFNLGIHPLTAKPFVQTLRLWSPLITRLAAESDGRFIVNIGSGFPALSGTVDGELPAWSTYATAVADECAKMGLSPDEIHLVIEPGRSLVEDHGVLVASVAAIKSRGRSRLIVLDAGTNLVRSLKLWHHPIAFLGGSGAESRYDIYGSQCYEGDLFARGVPGPNGVDVERRIAIGAAGGYDIPSANPWIRALPAIYGLPDTDAEEPVKLLREEGNGIR